MRGWLSLAACLACFVLARASHGADRVRLVGGGSEVGTIIASSKQGISLDQSGDRLEIPLARVDSVLFEAEPPQLTQARMHVARGGYVDALELLAEVAPGSVGSELGKQDLRFYKAYAKAQQAIAGRGDAGRAYQELLAFARDHEDSFHHYAAAETLGRLLGKVGRYDRAEKFYAAVARAEAPRLRVRGRRLAGLASQAQGAHAEAIRRFDAALAERGGGEVAQRERDLTRLAKAESLAATDQFDEAQRVVAAVVADAAEDTQLLATAYNTMGRCYEQTGDRRGALFSYLHTDLVFDDDPATHAEALARLGELWTDAGKPDHARRASERLKTAVRSVVRGPAG